jgi:hypothetical protein
VGVGQDFYCQGSPESAIIVFVSMEIMRVSLHRFLQFSGLIACFSLSGTGTSLAALVLQKVPPLTVEQVPAYPENLARSFLGTQIEVDPDSATTQAKSENSNRAETALLSADPIARYSLSGGSKTLLVSLSQIENIDTISFLNHGAKGNVTISTSSAKLPANSPQWHTVAQQELSADAVKAKVGPSEAKYVKLTFNVTEPGSISSLGIYPTPTVAAFTMPRKRASAGSGSFALVNYSVTDLHAKARALYVSSGHQLNQANNMIDDQPSTVYTFASEDAAPTAIIDLGKETKLNRISTIYSPREGNVEFFVLDSLPGFSPDAAPKTLRLEDATLANIKSVGMVPDNGTGHAAIDFPEISGRYVMVKWATAKQDSPFSVAEIAAFGGSKTGNLIAANTTRAARESVTEGKDFGDGKDFKDFGKEMPEEAPAEGPPPPLPDPPPFVFTPEVLPTSP